MGEAEAAVGAEEDDATVAAEAVVEIGDGFAGDDFRGGAGSDAVCGPLAEDEFHDGFAPASERDGGGEIVSVTTATDEGGVADTAWGFVEGAAGGGGGGEIAVDVEGDGADGVMAVETGTRGFLLPPVVARIGLVEIRAVLVLALRAVLVLEEIGGMDRRFGVFVVMKADAGKGGVIESGGLAGLGVGEALALAIEDEVGVFNEGHAVCVSELLSAGADEVDVLTFFKNQAGGLDGIAEVLDTGDAAGAHAAAVHEEGVELDAAVGGEEAAAAGVEGGVVFKDGDGGFNGVKGGTGPGEDGVSGLKSGKDASLVGLGSVSGDGPCAPVNEEDGGVGGRSGHPDMVEQIAGAVPRWFWEELAELRQGVKGAERMGTTQVAQNKRESG